MNVFIDPASGYILPPVVSEYELSQRLADNLTYLQRTNSQVLAASSTESIPTAILLHEKQDNPEKSERTEVCTMRN